MRLRGKRAVVTGAGSGFGEGIATRFAGEGAAVAVNDLDGAAARRVADAILAAGGRAIAEPGDMARDEDVRRLAERARDAFGGLDIFVANAGVPQRASPMTEVAEAEFDRIFAVNVKALYHAARAVVPLFAGQKSGVILVTASTAGLRPRPGLTWYNASKGAAIIAVKSMALELAPQNIRVNAICPVAGDTPMLDAFIGGSTPERRRGMTGTIPLGRLSTPEDVANAALYLASDEADFITGICLEVDGGRTA